MIKMFILPALLFCTYISAAAQQPVATAQTTANTTIEYVRVQVSAFLLRKNYTAYLTYGSGENTEKQITDASGKKLEFVSVTGVLNYMGKQGWEFVAYIPDDDGKISDRLFLMKRTLLPPQ
ncbi:hypothetical protein H7F15_06460 [Pontibacter sp. Tf4]|uniref:hypothetical protein n=1 Tax=Pontibacter sp. Tf4 TaxID=2761620 RepID=UPI001624FD5F|nr:hypothetical protein [Pontibacter sp. Tf4]MBB6610672.1 hypothetical protein [Pontibacter sp. Tf4]